jgi:Tc5 transposase DNA-binding domain
MRDYFIEYIEATLSVAICLSYINIFHNSKVCQADTAPGNNRNDGSMGHSTQAIEDGIDLTGEVLCQKSTKFANLVGIPKNNCLHLSEGWLTKFKARHNLKNKKQHGEGVSANLNAVEQDQ